MFEYLSPRERLGYAILFGLVSFGISYTIADHLRPPAPPIFESQPPGNFLAVDVQGEVNRPGLYRLPQGSRVQDAVQAAGGLKLGTERPHNLAEILIDGEQLAVGENRPPPTTRPRATSKKTLPAFGSVDLNAASLEELKSLPGIGDARAKKIFAHRLSEGPFRRNEDLAQVPGIGPKVFEGLRKYLKVPTKS
jgi:competence protein ComEA